MEGELRPSVSDSATSARAAWPEVRVDAASFAAYLANEQDGGAPPEHLADRYLAFAAASGDEHARRMIDERYLTQIDAVVRRIDSSPTFVDDVRQALRIHLLVAGDGTPSRPPRPPRIATFRGRGPLLGWIRVAAMRLALNMKRSERRPMSGDEALAEIVDREPDPALRHMKDLYRAEFGRALREALAAISERDRVLLRLCYVEGLRLARIGALYGVHEATASRWVSKATRDIADDAQRRLRERLALSNRTLESVARLVASQLDVSIGCLLKVHD